MRRKKLALLSLAALLCLLLSGCFVKTVDELYTLPRHSDEYDNLQKAIDEVMAAARVRILRAHLRQQSAVGAAGRSGRRRRGRGDRFRQNLR